MVWCAQRTLEEMQQYENHFKLPLEIHNKYVNLLSEDMDEGEESRFESFKRSSDRSYKIYHS